MTASIRGHSQGYLGIVPQQPICKHQPNQRFCLRTVRRRSRRSSS